MDHPVEKLDPLLRNLLALGLVEETPEGTWVLRDEVARRLGTLAELSARPSRSSVPVVYFDHRCSTCHRFGATRRFGERYLCDGCGRREGGAGGGVGATGVA